MEPIEIRSIAIDSAEKYYKYLERNDKGLQQVEVYDITLLTDFHGVYKLRLAAKLFDVDAVVFKLYSENRLYTTGEIKIVEYDADKNVLLVKPEEVLATAFKKLAARDIQVISDLKFLIERIKKWYELKGATVSFPQQPSLLKSSLAQIRYLPDLIPSENQQRAIRLIFHEPFSYVWGAPGTGKTQYVLSYAVLHYLAHNKRVAILAPTNNAIEQVLRGVLKMTDKADVSRKKILRLGVPSRKFAEEYPEICEERGIMKKLEELDKQISIYRQLVDTATEKDQLEQIRQKRTLFSPLAGMERRLADLLPVLEKKRESYLTAQTQMAKIRQEITQVKAQKQTAERKMASFTYKIGKFFSSKPSQREIDWQEADQKLLALQTREEHWKMELEEKENEFTVSKQDVSTEEQKKEQWVRQIKADLGVIESLRMLLSSWQGDNWAAMQKKIDDQLHVEQDRLRQIVGNYDDYQNHSLAELKIILGKLQATREKMAGFSTDERLKEVSVVACTLDGYVSRFTESKLQADHVFMDEAGYANIIKALTLFDTQGPVTFLGDHMQLPPVCEINDGELQQYSEYNNVFLWAQSAIFLEGLFSKDRNALLKEYLDNAPMVAQRMQQANLIQTFRFGKKLAAILDLHVYANGFASLRDDGDTKLYYVHAPKNEPPKSRISAGEVQAIRAIVEHLSAEEDFVILTPYKKQVQALGKALPKERNDQKILTVHGSQGREWDTVILSVVDTGDKWFVDSKQPLSNGLNLLNTAVSRTKHRLIIVCDYRYWKAQNGQLVTDLLTAGAEYDIK